jgi:hypothetical protein
VKLATWIAALACLMPAAASAAEPGRAACEVAAATITDHLATERGRVVVVVGVSPDAGPSKADIARRRLSDWSKAAPSQPLLRAWSAAPRTDVLQCPAVQDLLARRGIASGQAAADPLRQGSGGKPLLSWRGEILAVGMPVVSADGQDALVEIGSACGGLCGAGFLLHLRRANDAWAVAGSLWLWIS